jgi:23S rRNA (uracil1939-C5)-methyltransferase
MLMSIISKNHTPPYGDITLKSMVQDEYFDVELTANAYGGDAVGRLPDGRALFVPYALAGEKVRVRLFEEKPRFARGEIVEVLDASTERIQPRCAHFGLCGGCHYQQLPYARQLQLKHGIVVDQLQRIAGIGEQLVAEVVPSPNEYNYRNHIQLHLDSDGKPGYHRNRSNEVVAIQECHLPVADLQDAWRLLEFEKGTGVERVGLRTGTFEDLQVILEGDAVDLPELSVEDLSASVVHLSKAGTLVLAGSAAVGMMVRDRIFQVSAGSFFQVNLPVAEAMLVYVMEAIGDPSGLTVMDLYAGVGLFSAFIAAGAKRLVAVESSPAACDDFVVNLDEFENVELFEAPVEDVLENLDLHPDVILADPPRSGLGRVVIGQIARLAPKRFIYVSCDPATMARDTRELIQSGYKLSRLTPFDLFPQTYHVETIGIWDLI